MDSPDAEEAPPAEARVPRRILQLMGLILVALALLAIYSNIQRMRRAQIETVTIIPAPSPALTPAPSTGSP